MEDGGGRLFCLAFKRGARPPTENSRPSAIAGPGRLPRRSPSQKAVGAVLFDEGKRRNPTRYETSAADDPLLPIRVTPPAP